MDPEQFLTPMVAGALGFVSSNLAKMDTSVSLAIGGVTAVAGYLASKQDCSRRRKKIREPEHEVDEDFEDEEDVVVPVQTKKNKKKKKKKGNQQRIPKAFKKSSYEEDTPVAKNTKKDKAVKAKKETSKTESSKVDEIDTEGMSKAQIKRLRRKKREEEKKAAEAAKQAELKKQRKKEKRRAAKKAKKGGEASNEDSSLKATDELALKAKAEERKKQEDEEGWQQPKEHIKRAERKQEFEKLKVLNESKKSEAQFKHYVTIPPNVRGKVFGRKASNVNMLQTLLNVQMDLPKQGGNHNVVTITGAKDACLKAEEALLELQENGYSQVLNPGFDDSVFEYTEKTIGAIMGAGGKNFKLILKATGVDSMEKDDEKMTITIVGPAEGVLRAKEALSELASQGYSKITHPDWIKTEYSVPMEMVSAIIGKKGVNIKQIYKETQCKITTPKNHGDKCIIIGKAASVAKAIDLIQKTIERESAPVEPEPTPPEWQGNSNYTEDADWA